MKICCVIVCYYPDLINLEKMCNALLLSKTDVILIDNTEKPYLIDLQNRLDVDLITLKENIGIAKAQNIGIQLAIEKTAEVIVFFDQDSEIENDFIFNLTKPLLINQPMVVAPVFYDKKLGIKFPSYRLNSLGLLKKMTSKDSENLHNVDVVISSGTAATKEVFDIVGYMNEDYFIDYVDTEWCLRCRSNGIPILINPKAKMIHFIGEKSINLYFIRLFVHSNYRTFYKIRNSFLFIRSKHVPVLMGLKELISTLLHNFLILFFVKNKRDFIRYYVQAISAGLLNKKGKKEKER